MLTISVGQQEDIYDHGTESPRLLFLSRGDVPAHQRARSYAVATNSSIAAIARIASAKPVRRLSSMR